ALGVSNEFKQTLAVVAGGIAGVMALIGGLMLFHRRWTDPRIRKTSSFADIAILVLLLAQLILGIGTIFVSVQHLDGGEMVKFMTWAQKIFTFRAGAAAEIADVAMVFKLHLFLGLTIFLVFPFTRLVHMLSAPVRYVMRPGYQVVRSRRNPAE
ncbi:MAG: respiratory nitrate reductase subunit gamma, partial [Paracoccaceae bacterium]|nr:respiratory nitrate reductase subunit gamma [Paracoccaceae bacterium]